ncbi:hypothetical protein [Coleofasciculus sp. FACHB-129]|uniref:hypothetical protein n=1 Tax=Cyanophyceae TaxID=3028117 RepID=UPI001682377D|nr:hypothetical protein [Coleofasciculus sp. FACHB-129]MBD1896868.1 hypothetical protein [Coleofasciculus sp. FACHB-129]
MLREKLKQDLDKLNEEQLKKLADFIAFLEFQSRRVESSVPFWQRETPVERARELREWVSQLPKNSPSLPDEAFSRDSIYEE